LRPAEEADAHARPNRGRLFGEHDALGLELGGHRVDAADREPEMIKALAGCGRSRIDAVARLDRREEDVGAAELEIDARLALLHRADQLRTKHALEPLSGCLRVRAAQVDMIPGVGGHYCSPRGSITAKPSEQSGWSQAQSEKQRAHITRAFGFRLRATRFGGLAVLSGPHVASE